MIDKRVYVMDCDGFVKIGVSENPDRRKNQIPYKVKQYYCTEPTDKCFLIEREMHSRFRTKRKRDAFGREYFVVPFLNAVTALMDEFERKKDECVIAVAEDKPEDKKNRMSEKEKQVVEKLKAVIPKMSEFDKGYILGMVENIAGQKEGEEKKK